MTAVRPSLKPEGISELIAKRLGVTIARRQPHGAAPTQPVLQLGGRSSDYLITPTFDPSTTRALPESAARRLPVRARRQAARRTEVAQDERAIAERACSMRSVAHARRFRQAFVDLQAQAEPRARSRERGVLERDRQPEPGARAKRRLGGSRVAAEPDCRAAERSRRYEAPSSRSLTARATARTRFSDAPSPIALSMIQETCAPPASPDGLPAWRPALRARPDLPSGSPRPVRRRKSAAARAGNRSTARRRRGAAAGRPGRARQLVGRLL